MESESEVKGYHLTWYDPERCMGFGGVSVNKDTLRRDIHSLRNSPTHYERICVTELVAGRVINAADLDTYLRDRGELAASEKLMAWENPAPHAANNAPSPSFTTKVGVYVPYVPIEAAFVDAVRAYLCRAGYDVSDALLFDAMVNAKKP